MKKIFLLLLVSFIVFAAGAWLIPDAHADSGAMAYKGAQMLSGERAPDQFDGETGGMEEAAAFLLLILLAIVWLFAQDFKKAAKRKALKLFLNLLASVLAVPAPELSFIYIVIRFLIIAVSALVKLSKRS